jgi:uncharacterized protein (TIGR03435 family)
MVIGFHRLEVNRFGVRAKVPVGVTTVIVKPMPQPLLAKQFGLVVHHDNKPCPRGN